MIRVKWQHTYGNNKQSGGRSSSSAAPGNSLTLSPVVDSASTASLARRPVGTIWEMDTIAEDAMPPAGTATWTNQRFELDDEGCVRNRSTRARMSKDEVREHGEEVLPALIEHVHSRMLHELQFCEQAIPPLEFDRSSVDSAYNPNVSIYSGGSSVRSSSSSICSTADGFRTMVDSDVPRCIFHTSHNFGVAEKLLVFVCSSRGLSCGIWSRSLLLHDGVTVGSMIPYFQAAIRAGYGVLVMNPNMNTQVMPGEGGAAPQKLPIHGSSTQEEHCEHVWKKYIFPAAAHKIHFIAYGYGGALVAGLVATYRHELKSRLGNVAFIESSHKADPRWSAGFRRWFSQHSVCWVRSDEPLGTDLVAARSRSSSGGSSAATAASNSSSNSSSDASSTLSAAQLLAFGCLCLSAGPCEGPGKSPAFTARAALAQVFEFLACPSAYEFERVAARAVRLQALRDEELEQRARQTERMQSVHAAMRRKASGAGSGGGGVRRGSSVATAAAAAREAARSWPEKLDASPRAPESVTIDDFQLLRVVGKGAFGKVMLVRRKATPSGLSPAAASGGGDSSGRVYAMKVIKKAAVFARNQVEHTKTERRILQGRNFENILKLPLRLPTEFSDEAKSLLRGLLCKDPARRLGSGPVGANEIMEHPFFAATDWEQLYRRDVDVPFRPIVRRDGETSNVPEFFKRQDAVDSVVAESVPLGKSHVFQDFSYADPFLP
ncbi:hypothetical protein PybrP1_005601 [[Pythium] brassicae (nom. inval.)]|nr:hypothetical protein PybrP1_005601 [[Pythium] brassicae (nom. inval.)]